MFPKVGYSNQINQTSSTQAAARHPDIVIRPPSNNPITALATLCADNKVTYLSDIHGQKFIPELVSQSARELKRAGVDLLAVEFVKYSDNAAFREALSAGKEQTKAFIMNAWSKHGESWVDKIAQALCDAHANGIAVAGIDRHMSLPAPKTAMEGIVYMNRRLALNIAWNAAAEREERAIGARKTLVWGGGGHFTHSQEAGPKDMRPGAVVSFAPKSQQVGCSLNNKDQNSHILIHYH